MAATPTGTSIWQPRDAHMMSRRAVAFFLTMPVPAAATAAITAAALAAAAITGPALPLALQPPTSAAPRPGSGITFHAPKKMSSDVENCASAGGTDGFYAIGPPDGSAVFGPCRTNADLKFTATEGDSWSTFQFGPGNDWWSAPLGVQFQWNLVPVFGAKGELSYHTWGGVDVKPTARTPRSYTGANTTGVFELEGGALQLRQVARVVSIEGLPHDVNMSFPATGTSPGLPVFYGGPIRRADGALVATIGLYWAGTPLTPSPDGSILKMSVVAISSTDGYRWTYLSIVANATDGASSSVFGPNENDISLLADGKTLLCVLRMDGDGPCDSGSRKANGGTGGDYRYYASSRSTGAFPLPLCTTAHAV